MSKDKKLSYYGGMGFDGLPELGRYKVNLSDGTEKNFNNIYEAKFYYNFTEGEKALWLGDELVDAWYYTESGEQSESLPF